MTNPPPRSSVESTLSHICNGTFSNSSNQREWRTLDRFIARLYRQREPQLRLVPLVVWRAFFTRHPQRMLSAQRDEIRDLAEQFRAEDSSRAALNAIDKLMKMSPTP